ncbi:hypothetical protein [Methylobacter sp.]|uniref:hypothetical protein n=1 Tax=Methylobacter sp. TaxID=2051955 RepID=UPI003FA5AEB2
MQEIDLGQRQSELAIGSDARHQVDRKIKVERVKRVLNPALSNTVSISEWRRTGFMFSLRG